MREHHLDEAPMINGIILGSYDAIVWMNNRKAKANCGINYGLQPCLVNPLGWSVREIPLVMAPGGDLLIVNGLLDGGQEGVWSGRAECYQAEILWNAVL